MVFVLGVLLNVGCDDTAKTTLPTNPQSTNDVGPRSVIINAIETLRAQTVRGAFLIITDWDNEDAWVQFSVNDDKLIFLDMTSIDITGKDAPDMSIFDFVDGPVTIDQATTTDILSPEQVIALRDLMTSHGLHPLVTHLASKSDDGKYQGYQRCEQAVVHSLANEALADLILSIFEDVHGSKAISGFDVRLGNSRPPEDRGTQ